MSFCLQHVKEIRARVTDKDQQAMYDEQILAGEKSFQNINTLSDDKTKGEVNINKFSYQSKR